MLKKMMSYAQIHTGELVLVNRVYGCAAGTSIDDSAYASFPNPVKLHKQANVLLGRLLDEIGAERRITPVSGLRTFQEQQEIYNSSLRQNGQSFTSQYVALPGHSEHQTGLAVDLGLNEGEVDFLCPAFPYEGICQRFRTNARRFGFIERYPKGKEAITGISHEPWHFRYVGVPHADIMEKKAFTLEEYHVYLKQFRYGENPLRWEVYNKKFVISYIEGLEDDTTTLFLDDKNPYRISGNNIDGFIITQWSDSNG